MSESGARHLLAVGRKTESETERILVRQRSTGTAE
jgi:hypothetical protein